VAGVRLRGGNTGHPTIFKKNATSGPKNRMLGIDTGSKKGRIMFPKKILLKKVLYIFLN